MLSSFWPRRVGPADPLAAALRDHHRSGRPKRVHATRADGVTFVVETEEYFTLEGSLEELDGIALDRCGARVLDVGAGAGRHALALQARDREVLAIDVSPIATALCIERGVRDAREFDVMEIAADAPLGRFDTILFGMQTIGVAGGMARLEDLLRRLRASLRPGGELLVDSSALREPWEGDESDTSAERGEIVLSMRYRGYWGDYFPWLYLDESDLRAVASRAGLETEILGRIEDGEYLAALRPAEV